MGVIVGTHVRLRTLGHVCGPKLCLWGLILMGRFYLESCYWGMQCYCLCYSQPAEAETMFLWTNDSITLELFVLDLGGDVGGGGDQ